MSTPSEVLRQLLLDQSLGVETLTSPWAVFVGFFPGQPDSAICVYDTAGRPDGRVMGTGERIEHPGISIMVRGMGYPKTWEKAKAIALALDQCCKTVIVLDSEITYLLHNVTRTTPIVSLGMEEDGDRRRHLFTINATVTIEQVT